MRSARSDTAHDPSREIFAPRRRHVSLGIGATRRQQTIGPHHQGETMAFSRRHIAVGGTSLFVSAAFGSNAALAAAPGSDAAVTAAVEAFRKAMLANDRKAFEALCVDQLTYGHSSGKVQTKAEFIADATSDKTKWNSITLTDQTVMVAGSNAMARFVFNGENVSDGKTNTLKFGVLMVWVMQAGKWRLLARQGYKI
jgi:hypothetical protein